MQISNRQLEIIEAAGKLLSTSGVSGLTIKSLAKEMAFSESAIYRHFSSKEDIIIMLLNYLANNIDERLTAITHTTEPPSVKFKKVFQNQFMFFKTNPHFVVVVFSDGLWESSIRINEAILKIMAIKMKHLKPLILEGQKTKSFTDTISVDELTHIVMGTFRLQMYKWRISNFEFNIEKQGNRMIDSLQLLIKH